MRILVTNRVPLGVLLVVALLGFAPATPAHAQNVFIVNATGDTGDSDTSDNLCNDGAGQCTLRAAIEQANATANSSGGKDEIRFDLSGTTVTLTPSTQYPQIADPVLIDGYSAPGYDDSAPDPEVPAPAIVIDGENLSSGEDDLKVTSGASGTTIRGLALINAPDDGIEIAGDADGVTIRGCYVGVANDGVTAAGNGWSPVGEGVGIRIFSDGHSIGPGFNFSTGAITGRGNVISANADAGIYITADNVTIRSALIGTDATGDRPLGNGGYGIKIGPDPDDGLSSGNNIGNSGVGVRVGNTISANGKGGIYAEGSGTDFFANYIGLNEGGTTTNAGSGDLGNQGNGITLFSSNSRVGFGSGDGVNVVSGNTGAGIQVGDAGNTIAAGFNNIRYNYIGTDKNAENDLGNTSDGIRLELGTGNAITGNVIGNHTGLDNSGNGNMGIEVLDDNTTITRNVVGTNADGDDLGNRQAVVLNGASNNTIGGTGPSDGNVLAFSTYSSLSLQSGSDGNTVQGNYVGTNANGADLGNESLGIEIFASSSNVIGYGYGASDVTTGGANVVAYNSGQGVSLNRSSSTQNAIRGNRIYGNDQIGIDLGNDGETSNDIGDTDTGENNLQNTPEFDEAQTQYNESTGKIEVRYRVDSNPGDATYDIKVDFYVADSEASGEGKTYVGTDTYPQAGAGAYRSLAFAPPSGVTVTRSDDLVATATDANGNTSEFSPTSTPLPVELASFEAVEAGASAVRLTWETASETNNAGFEVQRRAVRSSSAAGHWESVGQVEGAGTTTSSQSYRFEDTRLPYEADSLVYRLKQIDVDGTTSYTDELVVRRSAVTELRLLGTHPNPARHQATVRFAIPNGAARTRSGAQVRLSLYDVTGRRVRTVRSTAEAGRHQLRLPVADLASGMYFLRLRTDGQVRTRKLTVVR